MNEIDVFPYVAAEVAMQAIKEGHARIHLSKEEVYSIAQKDIEYSRRLIDMMQNEKFIQEYDQQFIQETLEEAIAEINKTNN